ncbi:MAG: aminotransferase class III-fold pyridoxal phosphate-dependent enzyme [Eubacteriaceae bacterium]|nr:aminotransferase class III-fold pyridoxal phosphate-dependent enzyme [Eubacteriaceae bacterium]
MELKEKSNTYIANTYARNDLAITSGKGSIAIDEGGKEYIDMGSAISVNIFGYSDNLLADAVYKQMNTLSNASNLFYTQPQAELAQWLCESSGMKKAFFSNSGAEANECAIKAARKHSYDRFGSQSDRNVIVSLNNSFHGRTIATLAATGQPSLREGFGPFPEGFVYIDPNATDEMLNALDSDKVCAVMIELVQGESGVIPLEQEFVAKTAAKAKERGILLIVDEVQSGMGRTGTLFAFEQYSIQPDLVTLAKALGGGLPIGATLFSDEVKDALAPGTHGSTFGGNAICCAAALSVVSRIDKSLLDEVREKGAIIKSELSGIDGVEEVTGLGMFIGVKIKKPVAEVIKALIGKGVLALAAHEKLRLLPPLNISKETLNKALGIIKETLAE